LKEKYDLKEDGNSRAVAEEINHKSQKRMAGN